MSIEAALADLEKAGVMVSRPGEGHPQNPLFSQYGVCVGSHGGYGRTLVKAMRACLMCCGLGAWWRTDCNDNELLREAFDRIAAEHLGGLHPSHPKADPALAEP